MQQANHNNIKEDKGVFVTELNTWINLQSSGLTDKKKFIQRQSAREVTSQATT